jgi:hypothetical protein
MGRVIFEAIGRRLLEPGWKKVSGYNTFADRGSGPGSRRSQQPRSQTLGRSPIKSEASIKVLAASHWK